MKLILFSILTFVCFSITGYSQWVQTAGTPDGGGVTDMVVTQNGTLIVTCASFNWPTTATRGGVRRSTNGGNTWENCVDVYNARTLYLSSTGKIFASYWPYPSDERLLSSTNDGLSWTYSYSVGANNNIFSIIAKDNDQTVYIGTRTGVMKSTNGGINFSQVNSGIPANSWVRDLALKTDGSIYAATTNGVFRSTNTGASWQQFTGVTAGDTVVKLCIHETAADANGQEVIAGTSNGKVYEEGADLFMALFFIGNNTNEFSGLEALGVAVFMGQFNKGGEPGTSYTAYENGQWVTHINNEGLPGSRPISVVAADPEINRDNSTSADVYIGYFEGTGSGAKVFKRTIPIGIQQISSQVPERFSLSQNYPNPFNPMTKIKFNVTKASNVSITVFDVLGRHITTLVNEKLSAGTYETEWNANNMPGGVYFYKLETEDFSETKKMVLVK